jgi:hypothetical protein
MTRSQSIGGPNDKRLHRRQLFHWIGGHIDGDRSLSAEAKTEMYVECLSDSLRSGLWLKTPRVPDFLGKNREFEISLPICCFTETSVMEIGQHTLEYGRLGLGFPKRFVLQHSGMPVHYASEFPNHAVFASWCKLKRFLESQQTADSFEASFIDEIRNEFIYMSHFLKRMNKIPEKKPKKKNAGGNIEKVGQSVSKLRSQPVPKKYYGETLPYLEEREWRIVAKERANDVLPKNLLKNPRGDAPRYYLPYKAGKDLFTIVLPDERTYAAVIRDKELRNLLFGPKVPPVTLLCLKDIGTF